MARRYSWEPPLEATLHVYPCCLHSLLLGPESDEALFLMTGPSPPTLFCRKCRKARPWEAA